MNAFPQQHTKKRFESYTQNLLPFSAENNMSEDTMALADRIRVILGDMDGSEYGKQARLAKIAGAGRPVVNHWLSGQKSINSDHALAICNTLGYRIEWLLEGKGPKKKGEKESDVQDEGKMFLTHVTPAEMEILTAYRAASPMDRTLIETLCRRTPPGEGHNA
jgi:hypothetical protein